MRGDIIASKRPFVSYTNFRKNPGYPLRCDGTGHTTTTPMMDLQVGAIGLVLCRGCWRRVRKVLLGISPR